MLITTTEHVENRGGSSGAPVAGEGARGARKRAVAGRQEREGAAASSERNSAKQLQRTSEAAAEQQQAAAMVAVPIA